MNSVAFLVSPKTLSQTHTAIEFSASNGYISDLVLVHASGKVSLDRMAWVLSLNRSAPRGPWSAESTASLSHNLRL